MDKTIRVTEEAWDWLKTEAHKRRCSIKDLLEHYRGMANTTPEQRATQYAGAQQRRERTVEPIDHIA